MALMPMTDRPSLVPLGERRVKFAYVWRNTQTNVLYTSTFTRSRAARHTVIPTNGGVMMDWRVPTQPSVTVRKSGHATMMEMALTKCMSTPSKVCGPPRVIFCDRFAECTRKICKTIWLSANSKSIRSECHPLSLHNYLPSTKSADERINLF